MGLFDEYMGDVTPQPEVDMAAVRNALREWDRHNYAGHSCYYEEADDAGTAWCPSEYYTLGMWLTANGLNFPAGTYRIYGRQLSEPNFRSRISGTENPVDVYGQDRQETEFRDEVADMVSLGARPTLANLSRSAQRPHTPTYGIATLRVMQDVERLRQNTDRQIKALEEKVGSLLVIVEELTHEVNQLATERSEVAQHVYISVPADVADQITAEVEKRVERIRKRAGR